jgi:hypothetical protein
MSLGFKSRPRRYAAVLSTILLGLGALSAPSAQALQRPAGGTALESELYGVSCSSASACTAVGDDETSAGASVTLAERWNGTSWALQTTATPTGAQAGYLDGVSCPSASACTAVGDYVTSAGSTAPLAERWNGTSWSVQSAPTPSGATAAFLGAVSCASTSACTGVGYYLSSGTFQLLAEAWNGTSWSVQTTPGPTGATGAFLNGVSCTSSSACTATGSYTNSSGAQLALAEAWNGTAWTIQTTPAPTGATGSQLYGVSCTSTSACTAVGNYTTGAGAVVALAEAWNGTAWAAQSALTPSGATAGFLNGVSCTSASACTGAGWYETSPGDYETLAEAWNGTAWAIQTTPNPTGGTASYLLGVSCPSTTSCSAAGYSLDSTYTAFAAGWNGTAWALQTTPHP